MPKAKKSQPNKKTATPSVTSTKAKKSQPNKKTATPSVTSTRTRQQQERRPPTPHESSRPSATSPSTRKRKTNNHNVTPPTQEKRPRIHPLTTDDIPGIVQAVVNALPATPPDQGRTSRLPISRREDSAPSSQDTSEEDEFGMLCCLTWAV